MSKNKNLHKAKKEKNDEFYTQMEDIAAEVKHYRKHFKNKTVFCNCDDPEESNFFQYFYLNFKKLKLKRLITTHYHESKKTYALEYTLDTIGRRRPKRTELKGNGDFRSAECIEILKEADIVVTNPPFSLFREYIAQLMEYDKKFLVLGNANAATTKDIFPLIKDSRVWLGYSSGGTMWFRVPMSYTNNTPSREKIVDGVKYHSLGNACWFTNLPHKKRNEELLLYKYYDPKEFPKYDNYDAIEVGQVADIPVGYEGAMGVPVTFLDKHNPDQFAILGASEQCGKGLSNGLWHSGTGKHPYVKRKRIYSRIFIQRKK